MPLRIKVTLSFLAMVLLPDLVQALSAQGPKGCAHLVEVDLLLRLVDFADLLKKLEVHALLLGHPVKGGDVFGKA